MTPAAEAALTGIGGAALGALVTVPLGLPLVGAAVGGLNGVVSGTRGIYDWRSGRGVADFVLDSTWALPMTAAALAAHAGALARGRPGYDPSLSRRRGYHVYRRGVVPRRGFAITLGNVIAGAGDTDPDTRSGRRRRRLVERHEAVHVRQARALGPLFPVIYGGWMAVAGAAGLGIWVARRTSGRDPEPLARVVESTAYYANPLEWWAYSRDGRWPPTRAVTDLVWRRPAVAELTT